MGSGELPSFYVLLLYLSMHHIFKMKHKNKTTDVTHSPKPWLVTCGNFTDYMLSHVHPSTWSFTWLVFFFLFVFKSALLTYNFGMINCVHSTCTVWWVLTDVHACEIHNHTVQNIFIIFKRLCPRCSPCLLCSWPQASTVCFMSLCFSSPRSSYKCSHTVCRLLCLVLHLAWCFWDSLCC